MKWGVRRFRKRDGTLTRAGKKRQEIIENASKKAEDFSKLANEDAVYWKKANSRYKEPTEKQLKSYLFKSFGNDIYDKEALRIDMKEFTDSYDTDPMEWARKDRKEQNTVPQKDINDIVKASKKYMEESKKFKSMKIGEISKEDFEKVEQFVKDNKYYSASKALRWINGKKMY